MATWKDWFRIAKDKNFPLEKYFTIDQPKDLQRLHESGLPFYNYLILNGIEVNKYKEAIRNFVDKNKQVWIRVLGINGRYYKLDLRSYEEVNDFLNGLNVNLAEYQVQLFEFCTNKIGGNIVIKDNGDVYIDVVEGIQERASKNFGDIKIYFGRINKNGRLVFSINPTEELKRLSNRVLNFLKIARTDYLQDILNS